MIPVASAAAPPLVSGTGCGGDGVAGSFSHSTLCGVRTPVPAVGCQVVRYGAMGRRRSLRATATLARHDCTTLQRAAVHSLRRNASLPYTSGARGDAGVGVRRRPTFSQQVGGPGPDRPI